MSKEKQLSKRQLAVIDDLFAGDSEEQAVLDKHNVGRTLYNKWLANPLFAERYDQRLAGVYRKSALLIARSASEAASALLTLAKSGKGETARKACLDIITMHPSTRLPDSPAAPADNATSPPESPELSPETASKLLAVLAEET